SVVANILSNTFMKGDYSCVDISTNQTVTGNYVDTFMTAGKLSGTSPYFLAAKAKNELGINGSNSVSGTYQGYEGYYNYFNIGANDSAGGGAVANGLNFAKNGTTYLRPWTNPYLSIVGGADYIATSYIKKGQNTSYFQKFNVVYQNSLYSHQYATNVQYASTSGNSTYQAYKNVNTLEEHMVFYIPIYENMPTNPAALPVAKGNPNSYLKTLAIKDQAGNKLLLTPTFDYKTQTYTLIVNDSVTKVNISATAISKFSNVSGTGTYTLNSSQVNSYPIMVTAGDGSTSIYQILVVKQSTS
ncbi:MAG: hypothetical protein II331_07275, partial [Lachnospiraceae bacterium]|nr:hypothetical protein [Lachnospiraceae bacterium]